MTYDTEAEADTLADITPEQFGEAARVLEHIIKGRQAVVIDGRDRHAPILLAALRIAQEGAGK